MKYRRAQSASAFVSEERRGEEGRCSRLVGRLAWRGSAQLSVFIACRIVNSYTEMVEIVGVSTEIKRRKENSGCWPAGQSKPEWVGCLLKGTSWIWCEVELVYI